MNPVHQLRLARFVDREGEMQSFCRMLEDPAWRRPILAVWGDGGMGKSSLMLKMIHECSIRSLTKAEVIWTDTRNYYDYLGVMRKIRDDVGASRFGSFTQLVNFFTNPDPTQKIELVVSATGPIVVGEGMTVSGEVGNVTGVEIRDLMLVTQRTDLAIPEQERMAKLTDQFLVELSEVARGGIVVIFLDAIEKAAETTQQWVWNELLAAVRDGRLDNVRFVLGGRGRPTVKEEWQALMEARELKPLELGHILEFMVKRNIPQPEAEVAAPWLLEFSGGIPLKVASVVEAMVHKREQARPQ